MTYTVSMTPQYMLLHWSAQRLGLPNGLWAQGSYALGIFDAEGAVRGVVVLNQITGEGAEASFVSDNSRVWATRRVLEQVFGWIFDGPVRLPRVTIRVAASDHRTQGLALRLGFEFEARFRFAMPSGEDAVLMSMFRDQARYLPRQMEDG